MIEFTGINPQRVAYGNNAAYFGLTQKSIVLRVNLDSVTNIIRQTFVLFGDNILVQSDIWGVFIGLQAAGGISFLNGFWNAGAAVSAQWDTAGGVIGTGTNKTIIVTFDNSNIANNPILYLDGTSLALNESVAPAGVAASGNGSTLNLGIPALDAGNVSVDGRVIEVLLYDCILTAQEADIISDSRVKNIIRHNLIFAPNLDAAQGLGTDMFDGKTLGATNYIPDHINGVSGTPTGSPVGRGNIVTNVGIGVQ